VPDFLLHIEGTRASWRKLDAAADAPDFERRIRAARREGQPLTLPDFGTVEFTGASAALRGERSAPVSDSRFAITDLTHEGGLP
jgi:hypothetical protein